jgi:aldose sugar dehydrogenase
MMLLPNSRMRLSSVSLICFSAKKMQVNVPDTSENAKSCLCPGCPTYKKSSLTNTLFCARGKAKEKVTAVKCICPTCPVFSKYGLTQQFYCMKGKASDIKG